MAITISDETQELIEARMKELGFASSDQFLQTVVVNYNTPEVLDYDDLDAGTRAAIEEGQREIDAGLGIPWEQVRAELFAKYVKK